MSNLTPRISLIGKPGCHLCDEARAIIIGVCAESGESFEELSILDSPALADKHWKEIPVILVDGVQIAFWRITRGQLLQALAVGPTVKP